MSAIKQLNEKIESKWPRLESNLITWVFIVAVTESFFLAVLGMLKHYYK